MCAVVARQAVEVRAEFRGEGLQPRQHAGLLEGLGIQLDAGMGGVDAGAAAGVLLGVARVRRAVGAEEEARIAAPRRRRAAPGGRASRFSTGRQ